MKLHEHQAKALLRKFGVPTPEGAVAASPEEAADHARKLGGNSWLVKAQVHAGSRGESGGIQAVSSPDEAAAAARGMLGSRIVTPQTGPDGMAVKSVYVEKACAVARELYAAILINRAESKVGAVVSPDGGTGVEQALARPENIQFVPLGPDGVAADDIARMGDFLSLDANQAATAAELLGQACKAFVAYDAGLIEFNPLAITTDGDIIALDVKMNIDDNAMWRHPELEELRDEDEADPQEREANRFEINYARMDGDIGILTMGAGLGLATIDMVVAAGGQPADFMDVRPMASREQVAEGIRLLMRDKRIRVILVMAMGGGILHCDTIAEALATVYAEAGAKIPAVYHAAGTGKEISELTLRNRGVPVAVTENMEDAVEEAVRIAGTRAG